MKKAVAFFVFLFLLIGVQVFAQTVDERQDVVITKIVEVNDRQEGALGVLVPEYDRLNGEIPKLKLGGGKAHDAQARMVGNRGLEGVISLHFLTPEGKYPTPAQVQSIVDKLVVRDMRSPKFWANVRALAPKDWTWIEKPVGVTEQTFVEDKEAKEKRIVALEADKEAKDKRIVALEADKEAKDKRIVALEADRESQEKRIAALEARAQTTGAQVVQNTLELNGLFGAVEYCKAKMELQTGNGTETLKVVFRVPKGKLSSEESVEELRRHTADKLDSLFLLAESLTQQVDGVAKATALSTAGKVEASLDTLATMYGKDWIKEVLAEKTSQPEEMIYPGVEEIRKPDSKAEE